MKDSMKRVIDRIASASTFAGSMYTEEFLSSRDDKIETDRDIVKKTKNIIEKNVQEKTYNNIETIKYIKFKRAFLIKSNERDYVINHYSNIVNQVDFSKVNFEVFFRYFL